MPRFALAPFSILLLGFLAIDAAPRNQAAGAVPAMPPMYRFPVHTEITYESTSEFKYDSNSLVTNTTWKFWVVKRNPDGSIRLIIEKADKFQGNDKPRVRFGYCDVDTHGRIAANETHGFHLDPADVLIQLPQDLDALGKEWEAMDETTGVTRIYLAYQVAETDPSVINVEKKSLMDAIYESTHKSKIQFDRSRGLVTKIETETTQGAGINGMGTGLTELKSVEPKNDAWFDAFLKDSERYFEAVAQYDRLIERAQRETDQTDALLADAAALLASTLDKMQSAPFQEALNIKMDSRESTAEYVRQEAKKRAELVGQPSPEWETTDLDGNSHSIAEYRGKVVVLDFWYRGCGWCIRAMPQVRQVAEAFEGRPVSVLGMNTDRNEDDAKFVVDKMALNYPNLKAEGLPEKYGVTGFPTLIIIDQDGRVRDIHIGYSPTLRTDVSESITGLLERKD